MFQMIRPITSWYWTPWVVALLGWLIALAFLAKSAWVARRRGKLDRDRLDRAVLDIKHLIYEEENGFSSIECEIALLLMVMGRTANSGWFCWLRNRRSSMPSTRDRVKKLWQLLKTAEEQQPTYEEGFRFRSMRQYSIEKHFITWWFGLVSRPQLWYMLDRVIIGWDHQPKLSSASAEQHNLSD